MVDGDSQLLQQLFSNLIENAICHNGPGTVIRLSATTQGDAVIARVADNGTGIAEDKREEALKPFYRLDESRSTPGNGLGLALAAAIAKRHEAHLTLSDNNPGLRVQATFTRAGNR